MVPGSNPGGPTTYNKILIIVETPRIIVTIAIAVLSFPPSDFWTINAAIGAEAVTPIAREVVKD